MSTRLPQVASVTCPRCGNRFAAPVQNVIDVGRQPELKVRLLRGQLNIAVCPQCGAGGMLNAPFIYHDPEKELLFVFTPNGLNVTDGAQQRLIGDLTNAVMNSVPPEQRKAYLLQPKVFLTFPSLTEAILQADGITPEMLEARRAQARLLEQLLQTSDELELRNLIVEHDEALDYDFFALLANYIESARAAGQSALLGHLLMLNNNLLEMSSLGRSLKARREALESLGEEVTREELLEKLINAQDDGVVEVLTAAARPLVDYQFFQILTSRIETADEPEATRLKQLRAKILEVIKELDMQMEQEFAWATSLLREIWSSKDREQAIRAHLNEIDDLFLAVLEANIRSAEVNGEGAIAEELRGLMKLIFSILEETVPPQIRFINQLLRAEYPHGTQKILNENASQINGELLDLMAALGEDLEVSGREELGRRLSEIRQQAEAMLV